MTYGFRVINDFGAIQIDDTYANLAFISKGRIFNPGGTYPAVQTVAVSGISPMLFLQTPGGGYGYESGCTVSGGTWTFGVGMDSTCPFVDYYIFDRAFYSGEQFGIRIWDSAGNVTFDSGNKYLKVIDQLPLGPMTTGSATVSGSVGYNLACNLSDPGTSIVSVLGGGGGGGPYFYYPKRFGLNCNGGTVITCINMNVTTIPGGQLGPSTYTPPYSVITCDVTGL